MNCCRRRCCCCCAGRASEASPAPDRSGVETELALLLAQAGRELGLDWLAVEDEVHKTIAGLDVRGLPFHVAMAGEMLLKRAAKMMAERSPAFRELMS